MATDAVGYALTSPTPTCTRTPQSAATPRPRATAKPSILPTVLATLPPPRSARGEADLIPEMPPRDLAALAAVYSGDASAEPMAPSLAAAELAVGVRRRFWLTDLDRSSVYPITATLRLLNERVQMWVDESASAADEGLARSARCFAEQIYPRNRAAFGSEWTPGIDGDPRIVVLNAQIYGASGYFGSSNEYTTTVNPYSNQAEIIFMNLAAFEPGSDAYDAVLAHEFQHMIHWHQDSNEDAWLNEGAAELSEMLNGYSYSYGTVQQYARDPDLQLNNWPNGDGRLGAHYGASFLFLRYWTNRLGEDALRDLVGSPANGMKAVRQVLEARTRVPLDAFMGDWWLANWGDGLGGDALASVADGAMLHYPEVEVLIAPQVMVPAFPYAIQGTVAQYGADYYAIDTASVAAWPLSLHLTFAGDTTVPLLPVNLAPEASVWWSNRGDASHSWLRRELDLRTAEAPHVAIRPLASDRVRLGLCLFATLDGWRRELDADCYGMDDHGRPDRQRTGRRLYRSLGRRRASGRRRGCLGYGSGRPVFLCGRREPAAAIRLCHR